jgi:hypothetical protein
MSPRAVAYGLSLIVTIILVEGCAGTRPFTEEDHQSYLDDLHELQYYLSSDTYLSRKREQTEAGVSSDHRIQTYRGVEIEEIKIPSSTPGILIGKNEGAGRYRLYISFEPPVDGVERGLWFESGDRCLLEISSAALGGKRWAKVVSYDSKVYFLGRFHDTGTSLEFTPSKKLPYLLVSSDHMDKLKRMERELPGRTLD